LLAKSHGNEYAKNYPSTLLENESGFICDLVWEVKRADSFANECDVWMLKKGRIKELKSDDGLEGERKFMALGVCWN
jgi:hypothetical protein